MTVAKDPNAPVLDGVFHDWNKRTRSGRWKAIVTTGCIVTYYDLGHDIHPADKDVAEKAARKLVRRLAKERREASARNLGERVAS